MSPLFSYNGKILSVNGALAGSENCCCGGSSDGPPPPSGECDIAALVGDQNYVDSYCFNASTIPGFHCIDGVGNCVSTELIVDYGGGFGEWNVVICCQPPS